MAEIREYSVEIVLDHPGDLDHWIDGEAKRVIGFGAAELYTFVYRTPVGLVNIRIPREMSAGAPERP